MVMLVAWSPNGNLLASMSNDDTFRIWDLETGVEKIIQHASCDYSWSIDDCKNSSIAWSPDGNALAFTDDNSEIKVWDIEKEKVKISFESPTQEIIRFSWLNNEEIASIGSDRTIRIWNILLGEQTGSIGFDCKRRYSKTCYLHLYTVTWSSDNETLAFEEGYAIPRGGSDGGISIFRILNIVDGEEKFEVYVPKAYNISISPDAVKFAVGYFRSNIGIVDINNLNVVQVIGNHIGRYGITSIAWSPDGSKIASAGADGTIRIWGIAVEE
jgi:WD40 repeat protein